jgi:hypothetical protein
VSVQARTLWKQDMRERGVEMADLRRKSDSETGKQVGAEMTEAPGLSSFEIARQAAIAQRNEWPGLRNPRLRSRKRRCWGKLGPGMEMGCDCAPGMGCKMNWRPVRMGERGDRMWKGAGYIVEK